MSAAVRSVPAMSEHESDQVDLSWFCNHLPPEDQVSLLRNPDQVLPAGLAQRLMHKPGVFSARWLSNDGPSGWELTRSAATTLGGIRSQLDHWWSGLSPERQAYIMENRRGELDGEYADDIRRASEDPVEKPGAYLVVLVTDDKTGRFRLPQMIQVYVEMKTAE